MKQWAVSPKRRLLEMKRFSRQSGESNNTNWLLSVAAIPQPGYVTACYFWEFLLAFWFFFVEHLYLCKVESEKPLWMKETLSGVGVTECKGEGGKPPPKKTPNQTPIWRGTVPCDGQ